MMCFNINYYYFIQLLYTALEKKIMNEFIINEAFCEQQADIVDTYIIMRVDFHFNALTINFVDGKT